jgi:predicted MFS family arabinose efflux permease
MVLMALAFLAVPLAHGPVTAILVFALAGLGCSAVFPLTVGLATLRAPDPAGASSLLVASLMVGVGTASFALGALRSSLPLETIYRLSAGYPLLALVLAVVVIRRAGPSTGAAP